MAWQRPNGPLRHVVERAASAYDTPIALVSIVDRRREFFAARVGIDFDAAPGEDALCRHAVRNPGEAVVVTDTRLDPRFSTNPFVVGPPFIRFYIGIPLLDAAGYALGALCVIDIEPRTASPSLFELMRLGREAERIIAR